MRLLMTAAMATSLAASAAIAQDKLDFTVGGLKWRCQYDCKSIKGGPFAKVEQAGAAVTFTDAAGKPVKGSAVTHVMAPFKGPSLRCKMDPKWCGKEPPPKTSYRRTIEVPEWSCTVSVQQKNGEPDTPPPFKARWMRFAGPGCAMGLSIWTTLSPAEVRAIERRCGEFGEKC